MFLALAFKHFELYPFDLRNSISPAIRTKAEKRSDEIWKSEGRKKISK